MTVEMAVESAPMELLIFTLCGAVAALLLVAAVSLAQARPPDPRRPAPVDIDSMLAPPRREEWIVAFVWPREHATPEQLRALGRALGAWRAGYPLVTDIPGLDELLSGRYPTPDGPTPYVESPNVGWMPVPRRKAGRLDVEFRGMAVVDPWLYCPTLVYAVQGMESDEAIGSLKRSIPPELVRGIGYAFG